MAFAALLARRRTDDGPTACGNGCGIVVAPERGIREAGAVYCSEECATADWVLQSW